MDTETVQNVKIEPELISDAAAPIKERDPLFIYVRNKQMMPIACIAYRLNREENVLTYQLSTHNPVEKFRRTRGREVALERFYKKPQTLRVNGEAAVDDIIRELANHLMEDRYRPKSAMFPEHKGTPDRVRRALRRHYKRLDNKAL